MLNRVNLFNPTVQQPNTTSNFKRQRRIENEPRGNLRVIGHVQIFNVRVSIKLNMFSFLIISATIYDHSKLDFIGRHQRV